MDPQQYADEQIEEAIAAGTLTPTIGVGEPIQNLSHDPDWWVRAFLERELYPDRLAELVAHGDTVVARAVAADDLDEARVIVRSWNDTVRKWNRKAPPEFSIEPVSEIWLITERAGTPGH